MRGRVAGEQLEKVRAVASARNGLRLVHDGRPSDEEIDELLELYQLTHEEFVDKMLERMHDLLCNVLDTENPRAAIELAMTTGLLVDRLTNRALFQTPGVESNFSLVRTRDGIVVSNGEDGLVPYTGKEESL